jgi:hypothetical protein
MEWEVIETAPKDGTAILVYIPSVHETERYTTVSWDTLRSRWLLCQTGWYADDYSVHGEPSHWMPLPEPPK